MHRIMQRIRRRVPTRSAGYQSPDRSGDKPEDESRVASPEDSPRSRQPAHTFDSVTAAAIAGVAWEGNVLCQQKNARSRAFLRKEDEASALSWARLQEVYTVFQALEQAAANLEDRGVVPRDEGLRSLLNETVAPPPGVTLRDLRVLSKEMPEGFSPEMFAALGDASYAEMAANDSRQTLDIRPDAYEHVGNVLFSQSVAVGA
ncbi:TPA: hypothetical protein N0F65_006608 [Lagenidium giganteum]|uniref:Uncharacterized protein n=1 Tax=Lagenidium giganteum TaxID=4803 RepID=A0AAV2Z5Z3_9STRA|nr:TPA: hypothetical protein N0F65_006608 [Lagenidium giganteum]